MVVNACSLIQVFLSLTPRSSPSFPLLAVWLLQVLGNWVRAWDKAKLSSVVIATNCKILMGLGSFQCGCLIHNQQYSHNIVSSVSQGCPCQSPNYTLAPLSSGCCFFFLFFFFSCNATSHSEMKLAFPPPYSELQCVCATLHRVSMCCMNKLVVLTTVWVPWLQKDGGYEMFIFGIRD